MTKEELEEIIAAFEDDAWSVGRGDFRALLAHIDSLSAERECLDGMCVALNTRITEAEKERDASQEQAGVWLAKFTAAVAAKEKAEQERDEWKAKWENLEINRATCCMKFEEALKRIKSQGPGGDAWGIAVEALKENSE